MAMTSRDNRARHTADIPCVWTTEPEPPKTASTTTMPGGSDTRTHPDAQTATVLIVDDDLAAVVLPPATKTRIHLW
jgi:hypothetical protein